MLATAELPIPVMPSSRPAAPATPRGRLLRRGLAILFIPLLAGLAGCGGGDLNAFPPACPRAAILGDAADLTRYRPDHAGQGGQDLTDMVFDGRITGVSGKCARGGEDTLEVTATVNIELMRGPAMVGRVGEVPFFVAVAEGQRLLEKQVFRLKAEFPANTDRLRLTSETVNLTLPLERGKSGAAYDLLVGFQLSPDELALNRRRGPR
jgi:hypothetical protein